MYSERPEIAMITEFIREILISQGYIEVPESAPVLDKQFVFTGGGLLVNWCHVVIYDVVRLVITYRSSGDLDIRKTGVVYRTNISNPDSRDIILKAIEYTPSPPEMTKTMWRKFKRGNVNRSS
jgi:hypothetical protein